MDSNLNSTSTNLSNNLNPNNNFSNANSILNNTANETQNSTPNTMDMSKLPLMALEDIPTPNQDAKEIVALVKSSGKVTGYQLSDGRVLDKEDGVNLARQGGISGVGIASRNGNEYLKSLPDGSENNNLGNLPSISGNSNNDNANSSTNSNQFQ